MNPIGLLFLLFLLIPLVEIYFLIKVGSVIGAIPTVALVIFTALLGAMLLRFQGLATLQRTRSAMAQGQIPAMEMFEGVLLVCSGALLLTPGFVTDAIGFLFLAPPFRKMVIRWFLSKSTMNIQQSGDSPGASGADSHTIEGEFRREDD